MADAYTERLAQLRCVAANVIASNGGPAVADALGAIIGGAIVGAVGRVDLREIYGVVQGLADDVAASIAHAERGQIINEKGQMR